ncbi:MAG: hypothetical protein JO013_00475 [Alphaproteobacteria bacterium]|nr:hypothetical protein [Alphaproteobacteria bacterium]
MQVGAMAALALAGAAPAKGDLTATYRAHDGGMNMAIRVEVSANGDIRADLNVPGLTMIRKAGRSYFITHGESGPLVEDLEDMGAVLQEEMQRSDPHFCDKFRTPESAATLKPAGTVTIAGFRGEAYALVPRAGGRPDLVISRDPALAALGGALAAQFRLSKMILGECASRMPMMGQMDALLESGTALQLGATILEKVEPGPIDPARFDLPAPPATREQVRETMMRKQGPVVTLAPRGTK